MDVRLIKTECALSRTQIQLADYTLNPYKGCSIGCLYCYAKSNQQIKKINKPWGQYLYIKENFIEALELGLKKSGKIDRVLIGSTTEPFQFIEETYHFIKKILQQLKEMNIPCVILTKSDMVADFIPYLTYNNRNKVYITYNNEVIRELFELNSISQNRRIKAAEKLIEFGIDTTVYISPVFPYLTDVPALLDSLKNKVQKVYCESYNPVLGNWEVLKLKLSENIKQRIEQIYNSNFTYNEFWDSFVANIDALYSTVYTLKFFIYPFNSYYNSQ